MMRHQPDLAVYLKEMKQYQTQKDFGSEVFPLIEKNEPTLLYVIRHKTTQSNLKCQLYGLLQVLYEASPISI